MAIERNPSDPYRAEDSHRASDPTRPDPTGPDFADEGIRRSSRLETDLQADPELTEGPASGPKIALLALGIALLLGAVFYGLNNSTVHQAGTSPTAQKSAPATAQNTAPTPPPASPANPGGNAKSSVTTGAAPSQTPPPPASSAPASNAPAANAPASK